MRICVCGDEGTGKSSLIASFVKGAFTQGKIQPTLPLINLPSTITTPGKFNTVIVDTSALPQERDHLNREIRKCNVVLLVYSNHYSYERVGLFWLPHFRSLGVNVPVVLCESKADLNPGSPNKSQMSKEEILPLMSEFKEIDCGVRASASKNQNVVEVFHLCQKAVVYPLTPLYDSKESNLKPATVSALRRIFWLSDKDQDGYLSNGEMKAFSQKCFASDLSDEELGHIKEEICEVRQDLVSQHGITKEGFVVLSKIYAERARHDTVWRILRAFHYADSVSLQESFIHPKFEVPKYASAELSPAGYQFLFDLFLLFDKDNDGGLNHSELDALFAPTPGLPSPWIESSFPASTVVNDSGHVTLQGWLAQWSMTTFTHPRTTLEYLAFLGYEPPDTRQNNTTALKITKPRSRQRLQGKLDRNVVSAYLVGAPASGKSSLLDAFLSRPFSTTYHPTIKPRTAVNSVELSGGKQCYLIMEELGELEPAILENSAKLDSCDLLIFTYDSSDPDSFAHIPAARDRHSHFAKVPSVLVALKADKDKANQRTEKQPDDYTAEMALNKPLHVSATWHSVTELFVQVAAAALKPSTTSTKSEDEVSDRTNLYIAMGAAATAGAAFIGVYRQLRK